MKQFCFKKIIFVLSVIKYLAVNGEFCQSNVPSTLPQYKLPQFPDSFETRILLTNNRKETSDVLMLYDRTYHSAELLLDQNGFGFRRIYNFETNQFFLIRGLILNFFHS